MSSISSGTTLTTALVQTADTSGVLQLQTNGGTTAVTIDTNQNFGLGVTPSTFTGLGATVFESNGGATAYRGVTSGVEQYTNTYFSGGFLYKANGYATRFTTATGAFTWYTAPSGTAGSAITFTQAMTLDVSGNLGVGTTSPSTYSKFAVINTDYSFGTFGTTNGTAVTVNIGSNSVTQSGYVSTVTNHPLIFQTNGTERTRIDTSGNLLVGATSAANNYIGKTGSEGSIILDVGVPGLQNISFYGVNGTGWNAAATGIKVPKNGSTNRSINAAGTINASGADYAEYMVKAGDFIISKGDIAGIDKNGKLTNVFSDSISFVVKSTSPSYVGGDTWGSVDSLGEMPKQEANQDEKDAYAQKLEDARQLVDRIAFSGQVPVNVTGATAGQYIIPVNDNGSIKGQAVSNPTFEQYQQAVGKVIAIEQDGRARIIVKVA